MIEWLNSIANRLRLLLKRRQLEKDLKDELSFHLAMREMHGSSRRFGNVTQLQEDCREVWIFGALERFWADIRYAFRLLLKSPAVSLGVMLSLSFGVGVTASMFRLVDAVMLRPLPVPHTNRVLRIASALESEHTGTMAYPDFQDLRKRTSSFDGIAANSLETVWFAGPNAEHARITVVCLVSPDFFSTMQVEPLLGAGFRQGEQSTGGEVAAILSYGLWQREFSKDHDVIGRTVRINGKSASVVGVMPKSFDGLNPLVHPEIYVLNKSWISKAAGDRSSRSV